jgi:uncharacterized membrane protein YphA (DoxX/SURF4 family)
MLAAFAALVNGFRAIRFGEDWPLPFLLVGVLAALAILGPGAYSVDAWLFGRRKLIIGRPPTRLIG